MYSLFKNKRINKKGQVSRTIILFSILIFYSVLFVFYGVYGATKQSFTNTDNGNTKITSTDYETQLYGDNTTIDTHGYSKSNLKQLVQHVGLGIKDTPPWLNTIFFSPAVILVGYLIIASFFPTANAGG